LPYISSPEQSLSTIRIYPNPTTGELFLEGLKGGEFIELYDFLGKRLIKLQTDNVSLKIQMTSYPDGIYIILIHSHGRIFSVKVVKVV